MPFYTFKNRDTGEEHTVEMKISERDQYVKDHPEMTQLLRPTRTVDPILLGITKPSKEFQEGVLGPMKRFYDKANRRGDNPHAIGNGRWDV